VGVLAHTAFPADGFTARWQTWDCAHEEVMTLRWENEGWTATGEVGREKIHYVVRLSPLWQVRQMLLFRDLEEPDLWLATDGSGRWGEMNGAHRTELDGCRDLDLGCTPFTMMLPVRRLPVDVGDEFEVPVIRRRCGNPWGGADHLRAFTRDLCSADGVYRESSSSIGREMQLTVDEYGLSRSMIQGDYGDAEPDLVV
jgi:hypothetical protein